MRTPIHLLVAALLVVSGCTHYHVTPAGSPSTARVPEREPIEQLELDIGRPIGNKLLIQTNRPAYVAIFEIVPNRGVTLIYPAAAHQQNMLVSGLTWVPLWWSAKRVSFTSDRYIYAVASDEPLNLSGETFVTGYFSRVLGVTIYRAEHPYSTMRAISRTVVPSVAAEEWAEAAHVITPRYHLEMYRTVRIHCPGSRIFDVPEDMVHRIWCPTRTTVVFVDGRPRTREYPVGRPARPDSVYGQGGTRIRIEPRRPRGPIGRVVDPTGRDRDDRDDRDRRRTVRDVVDDRNDRNDRNENTAKPEKPRRGRIFDLIDAKREEQEREKQERQREKEERERQRREAEEARRREAEERRVDRGERRDERRDERKDERRDQRDERRDDRRDARDERQDERSEARGARKDEREERRDERKEERADRRDEPKQQGHPRDESRREPREQPSEQSRDEKREQPREEKREQAREEKPQESRQEPRDDNKGRGSIREMVKEAKEKEKEKPGKP